MRGALKPIILKQGQKYVDDPVQIMPKKVPVMERTIGAIFDKRPGPQPITVRHNRIRLNWIKP